MSYAVSTVLAIASFVLFVAADEVAIPDFIKTCKRGSDDYNSCLRLAIQESWPNIVNGVPELKVPKLDPYYIKYQEAKYESGENIRGTIEVNDVYAYGLAKARFLAVRPELTDDSFRVQIDYELPKIFMEGHYKAEGILGPMKMGGTGYFNISLGDLKDTWDIQGHVVNDRWVIDHFGMFPEVGDMKVWFSDLFNGNQELNDFALKFVNDYWPVLYREMLPILTAGWDAHITTFLNEVFANISFAKLFP